MERQPSAVAIVRLLLLRGLANNVLVSGIGIVAALTDRVAISWRNASTTDLTVRFTVPSKMWS